MLGRETVNGFYFARQVRRNIEGPCPNNSAQNRPPMGRVLGLEHFSTLLQILRSHERTGNLPLLSIRTVY